MDFDALVTRLVAERRPSWLVYRSAPGRSRSGHIDQCRDAWNLWPDAGSWWIVRGWGDARTEERFDSEEEACAELYARVVATGEVDVRAMVLDELPTPVQRMARLTGLAPTGQRPGDLTVLDRGMGLRVVETAAGYRVDRSSLRPPAVGETWYTGLTLDQAARIVLIEAAEGIPRRPGMPRWGLPGRERERAAAALDRLADVPLERLESAYLGVPQGVLVELEGAAAVDFLTEGLIALAENHGFQLAAWGNEDSVELRGDVSYRMSRTTDGFRLEFRPEKSNDYDERGRFATLGDAREALVRALGVVR